MLKTILERNTHENVVSPTCSWWHTKILHTFGLETVRHFLLKYEDFWRFNIPFILEPLDFMFKKKNSCLWKGTLFTPSWYCNEHCVTTNLCKSKLGVPWNQVYNLIESNYSPDIRQYFMENVQRFLDDCEILSKTDLIKLLLTILNSMNNDIKFSK